MSIEKMSEALKTHIVSRVRDVITADGSQTLTQRRISSFEEYTSSKRIRTDTDSIGGRHEAIMSRGAFSLLLEDMSEAVRKQDLSQDLAKIVANASFDEFVGYISELYYKDKTFLLSDNRRVKDGFVYSGPTRDTTDSVAVYAKAVDFENDKDVLLLKNIPQDKVVGLYVDYLTSIAEPKLTPEAKKQLKASLQGGHLTGVFTARLIRAFGLRKDEKGEIGFTKLGAMTDLEHQLGSIVELVTDADYLSSNIVSDVKLFAETDKRLYSNAAEIRMTTEVQFAGTNFEAGRLLTTAGLYLSKLISSISATNSQKGQEAEAKVAFEKLLLNLKKVSDYIDDRLTLLRSTKKLPKDVEARIARIAENQRTINALITTEGSPSIVQHMESIVLASITGKKVKTSVSKAKVSSSISKKGTKVSNKPKKPSKNKKLDTTLRSRPLKQGLSSEVGLDKLMRLLNFHMQDTISANMGDGNDRNILNYRTGRLASSVEVERLSQGRSGMITAFYSYMKYPYATFSTGGKQSSPVSRDPKLLIAKSIREIASQYVSNQMRSVNV